LANHTVSSKQRSTRSASNGPKRDRRSRRNVVVLASLLCSLVATSLLLIALAPAPLAPDAAGTLFAVDQDDSFDRIFTTRAPVSPGRWTQIFIHHSRTRGGNAVTLGQQGGMGDHFLIGNGIDCGDGEVQIGHRWSSQQPAKPEGAQVAGGCISICLVGDLDQAPPTANQLLRLEQLVQVLQRRLDVRGRDVVVMTQPGSTAGIGTRFPVSQLGGVVLP
jgi:hypothetical protein